MPTDSLVAGPMPQLVFEASSRRRFPSDSGLSFDEFSFCRPPDLDASAFSTSIYRVGVSLSVRHPPLPPPPKNKIKTTPKKETEKRKNARTQERKNARKQENKKTKKQENKKTRKQKNKKTKKRERDNATTRQRKCVDSAGSLDEFDDH